LVHVRFLYTPLFGAQDAGVFGMRLRLLVIAGVTAATLCLDLPLATAQEAPTSPPQGFITEPGAIERAVIFADRHITNGDVTNGFYVDAWNMIPGAGWMSAGPGYRQWYKKDQVFVGGSAAISSRGYKAAQGRFELPRLARSRLAVGSQFRWQHYRAVDFYGEGPDTHESNRSEYDLRSTNVVGYATLRAREWMGITGLIGWLQPSRPSNQPTFVHSELSATVDTRDFPGHPTRGGLARAAMSDYSDRDAAAFSFRRYDVEAAHFIPVAGARVVVAAHGWLAATVTDEGRVVPFYLQPSLGGHNSLRSYADYRFHDRHLLLFNVEARIAMMTHVDAAVFVDAGNVAARVSDLDLDKRSYGAGLRLHNGRQTFARFDIAQGGEGWQVLFRLTDPLNLSRLSRRTATVPFVP
jgi:hypothetical protein